MHDDHTLIEDRVDRFVAERLHPALYRRTSPVRITAWDVPDEPVPFDTAIAGDYRPFSVGAPWGKPWGTVWFHVQAEVPEDWTDPGTRPELVVDLSFSPASPGFQAEGIAWRPDGTIVKAIEPRNTYVPVGDAGSDVDLYIEAAANPNIAVDFTFVQTAMGDKATAGTAPVYELKRLELALLDETVWELIQDVWTLRGLITELPIGLPRRSEIVVALDRMVDAVDPEDVAGTAADGRAALADVLASPAHASAHRVLAVGHAHIDSAWLWPVRETVRKVARTFSNVLDLIEQGPDFVFAASSAQQYAWLKQHYPEVFERVRQQVAAGRFAPVGGMWVESDTNMPGGEALARQFVFGKRFFLREFDVEPQEAWLPDSFGYTAALPQIVRLAGSRWFLTQKPSWNDTNTMPHHSFLWEGIDGSRVFTHLPPVDSYNSDLSATDLARAQNQYSEKGHGRTSLVPFGWGDGGGGPTREMVAAARRTHDLEGSPQVTLGSPQQFFETAEAEIATPAVWSGEMYLELHRGTLTSQARTKRGNRRSEHLLREAELWSTAAAVLRGADYPYEAIDAQWEVVLLQQFHDILPGSSIAWVHQEAERNYAEVAVALTGIIDRAIDALAGEGDLPLTFNAGPYRRAGVAALGAGPSDAVTAAAVADGDSFVLRNDRVRYTIDARGLLVSAYDLVADREAIAAGSVGNLLQLFRDTPNRWDAWDIDKHYKHNARDLTEAVSVELTEAGTVRIVRQFGASRIEQHLSLDAESGALDIAITVDWHEQEKLLKLAFPLDVHADQAASEIQFGHIFRPTHTNTSWDAARFETVAHRWVHVGEPGFGVSVANDASYGHDIQRTTQASGEPATVVRVSLLRAALYPDPGADQGQHEFTVSLRIGAEIPDAVEQGYRLNLPVRSTMGAAAIEPLVTVDNAAVVVEAVKLADDRSGDVVLRLYEAHGSRARATVRPGFGWSAVEETDLLERPVEAKALRGSADGAISVTLTPFQITTLRITRS